MKTIERPEGRSPPSLCAQCGSEFSSIEDSETFCATCLLATALRNEDVEQPVPLHRFDQYELITGDDGEPVELGRGAMGVTYKAFDTNLRYEVALKVIHPRYLADESSRARFLSEARAAAQLRHRNIASVFHLGSERDENFYAMELVDGETIEARVRRKGPLDCASALDITLQITRALIATGSRRFVHRDIKPSNIMLCTEADGAIVAKLIDFGLVRAIADQTVTGNSAPTRDGFIGTPHFASPEQFAGQPTDARSDIYSLGVTLWFMLTGKLPFDGTRMEIQQRQLSSPLPLGQLKEIPRVVVDLIKRMLEVDPAKRPQSPAALKEQLNKCIAAIDAARQKQGRRFVYGAVGIAALIITALGASNIFQHKLVPGPASEIVSEKSIAVLPFENRSEDKANAYFTDGVQEEILTDLAKIADLKVISRTSVMQYKNGVARNMREIAKQLGVANVVEGSVQRSGNRVRVNAQLVDARNDAHLWAQTYDRDLADVFAIQSEIAKAIADQLQAKLSPNEKARLDRMPTQNPDAYVLYIQAHYYAKRPDMFRDAWLKAEELFEQAIKLDPNFALAFAGLSEMESWFYRFDPVPARREKARLNANEALRLQPDLPEGHLALGFSYYYGDRDYERALSEFEIAKRDLPNEVEAYMAIGSIQRRQGRWAESNTNLEKSVALGPRDERALFNLALSYMVQRNFETADEIFDRTIVAEPLSLESRLNKAEVAIRWKGDVGFAENQLSLVPPGFDPDGFVTCERVWVLTLQRKFSDALQVVQQFRGETLPYFDAAPCPKAFLEGRLYLYQGDKMKAQAAFEHARTLAEKLVREAPDDPTRHRQLGAILAGMGLKEDAIKEGKKAVELLPESQDAFDGPQATAGLAEIYAWIGEHDEAFRLIDHLLRIPSDTTVHVLKLDPVWDPLRGDPQFENIVASLASAEIVANESIPEKSIAVLPFANLSDEKEHTFFADGVQDDVLTKLAKVADLKVISRTSVMQYRGKQDSRRIGRELGVSHMLEGTVRRSGAKVHVNARLVDTRSGAGVWAQEYERELDDVFAIEAELAQSIANQLGANVSALETLAIQERPTQDLVAYDLYARARNLDLAATFGDNVRRDYLFQAADLLNQAVARDPSFFEAYCELARVNDRIYLRGYDHTPARLAMAEAATQAAFRLRPDAGETHLARGENLYAGHQDYDGALRELKVALQSLPNDARIFQLIGFVQRRQGLWEESTRNLERAVALNPRDLETVRQIAISYDLFRRHAEEASLLDHALAIEPDHVETKDVRALLDLEWKADTRPLHQAIDQIHATNPDKMRSIASDWLDCALAERDAAAARNALIAGGETPFVEISTDRWFVEGLIDRMTKDDDKARVAFMAARAEQEKIVQAQPNFGPPWCVLGLIDAALGRKEEALREGRRAIELSSIEKDSVRMPAMIQYLALIAAWAGDNDLACKQLAIAVRPPSWLSYGELKLLPWWDPLRGDPRFEQIVASLAPK